MSVVEHLATLEVEALAELMLARDSLGGVNVDLTREYVPQADHNAASLLEHWFAGQVRYVETEDRWLAWDGTIFAEVLDASVHALVGRFYEALRLALQHIELQYTRDQASTAPDEVGGSKSPREVYVERWKSARRYRDRLGMEAGQAALFRQLKKQPNVAVSAEDLDSDPDVLVLADGVLDLRVLRETLSPAESLVPHDPARLVTRRANASLSGSEGPGWWRWYLAGSIPDAEVRAYLQRIVGASLLGTPSQLKAVVNLIGPTDSGKSVFLDTLAHSLGSYVGAVDSMVLLKKRNEGPGYEAHEMRGRRVVTTTEPGVGKQIDDELVKKVTGGDPMTTRTLRGKPITWQPQCQLMIASNQPMRFDTADTALLKRLVPIEFPVSFVRPSEVEMIRLVEGEEGLRERGVVAQVLELRTYLRSESELRDVLRWVVEGLLSFLAEGLGPEPEGVTRRRSAMAVEVDSVREWWEEALAEEVVELVGSGVAAYLCRRPKELYTLYRMWCEENGVREKSSSSFKAVLTTVRGVSVVRSNGPRMRGVGAGPRWPSTLVPPQ